MKPLIVLLLAFVFVLFALRLFRKKYEVALSARIAMSAMLLFTAVGHFVYTKGMSMMVPDFIPYKTELVYFTGLVEIVAAIGLVIPSLKIPTAWLLILFFILILPANVNAAINQIDYQKASYDGSGLSYLWFRVPLQILFILWTYLSTIKFKNEN